MRRVRRKWGLGRMEGKGYGGVKRYVKERFGRFGVVGRVWRDLYGEN